MAGVAIPQTCKLLLRGNANGQQVFNVLHYKYGPATFQTTAQLDAFITAWRTAHLAQWLLVHGTNYSLQAIEATDISSLTGATAVQFLTSGNGGTGGSVGAPNNVAYAISWRTGNVGRRNRGRSFMGAIPSAGISADTVQGALLSNLATLASAIIAQTFTGGYDFAVTSVKDVVSRIIFGAVLETITDSMRRRLPTRGN